MTASLASFPVMSATDRIDALRLARTSGVGPINFARLMTQYGSAGAALAALPARMRKAGRREEPVIPSVSRMTEELERLEKLGGNMLIRGEPAYPLLLSHVPDAPPVLFTLGDVRKLSVRSVGVVGARNASAAGIRMAESLSAEMAHAGLCVISGLARGIELGGPCRGSSSRTDSRSHRGRAGSCLSPRERLPAAADCRAGLSGDGSAAGHCAPGPPFSAA